MGLRLALGLGLGLVLLQHVQRHVDGLRWGGWAGVMGSGALVGVKVVARTLVGKLGRDSAGVHYVSRAGWGVRGFGVKGVAGTLVGKGRPGFGWGPLCLESTSGENTDAP